jgi:hypothetical protein
VFGKHNIIRAHQLENQILTLSPNDFSCIEDYLSKFKTLRILCEECKIKMEEERCIYIILSKLGSAYFVFVSTFYAMREALGKAYQKPTLESFCDALIREQDKLVQLGVINTAGTSNKALVAHRKINPRIPRSNILATTTSNIRVPNPLRQLQLLMVTKEKNIKIRRLTDIATFVIKMVMMSPNVSRRWQL